MQRVWQKIWIVGVSLFCLCGHAHAISARSAVVLDGDTGQVHYEKNAEEVLPMASTTKIMTALIAIEEGNLDRTYTVKPEYTQTEGSSMYLKPGETLSIRDTLYGLMLMSGNDAALAIAGECGGQQAFVQKMNEKAESLGLTHTHFENPNGLDGQAHHTTALELAQLAAYALKNPEFREIVSTKQITCGTRTMVNHNKMLQMYPDAIGVKTGFTKKSGRCLVSAAERNGRTLVAVTLNAPDDWKDHMEMLDQAFAQYQPVTLHQMGDSVGTVVVEGGELTESALQTDHDLEVWLAPGEQEQIETTFYGRKFVYAPTVKGGYYGEIEYKLGDFVLGVDSLAFSQDIAQLQPKLTWLERLLQWITQIFQK